MSLLIKDLTWHKAWRLPHEESTIAFGLNAIKFLPAIFALQTYSFLTVAYPLTAGLANGVVVLIILMRLHAVQHAGLLDAEL